MTILSRAELTSIITRQAAPCVSIFMPTHFQSPAQHDESVQLDALLCDARDQLRKRNVQDHDIDAILKPIGAIRRDPSFWKGREETGLALFAAPDFFQELQVPLKFRPQVRVGKRFHVRPLIQLLMGDSRFFILALTEDSARLFEATKFSLQQLDLDSRLAASQICSASEGAQQTLPFSSAEEHLGGQPDKKRGGQPRGSDTHKQNILRHFQRVDQAVSQMIRREQAPLVLACVGYLAPLYQSINSYRGLIQEKVPGNPNIWDCEELRDRAWQLVSPALSRRCQEALHRFEDAQSSDQTATETKKIVLAARSGQVETLFLERDRTVWGEVDPEQEVVRVQPENGTGVEELLEFAASYTLIHGGHVYSLDRERLPTERSPAAALLRRSA